MLFLGLAGVATLASLRLLESGSRAFVCLAPSLCVFDNVVLALAAAACYAGACVIATQ